MVQSPEGGGACADVGVISVTVILKITVLEVPFALVTLTAT